AECRERAVEGAHGRAVRRRLRLHLPLSRDTEGGASRRPGHPHHRGPGCGAPDRRPLRTAGSAAAPAFLVGHRFAVEMKEPESLAGSYWHYRRQTLISTLPTNGLP